MSFPHPRRALADLQSHLHARLRDQARALSFARFLSRRVLDDNVFEAAGALSYTTAFALVPISVVVFGVLSAFPVFDSLSDQLSRYIFDNFVPSAASAVEGKLRELVDNAGKLTAVGVIALVVSLMVTLTGVEAAFNRIWRVKATRPRIGRFLVYWTVLTLGSLMAAASLAVSARFFALSVFQTQAGDAVEHVMLRLSPMLIELFAIATIYRVVPHRTVKWRHALLGALLATALLELVKWVLGAYLGSFGAYSNVYGTLAFVPVFLLWIFMTWVAVLLGASLASSISAFRYQPVSMRLPEGYEMYGLLRLLARFQQARTQGQGLHSDRIQQLEPMLTDTLVQQMLAQLCEINVVRRAESGEWLLARDLDDLTLAELYEACHLRIPIAEALLPCRHDELGNSAVAAMDELRIPLRDLLKRKMSTIHADEIAP